MSNIQERLGYKELAILAMQRVNRPITPSELWDFIIQNKLHYGLDAYDIDNNSFIGKTPEATFGARIYTDKEIFKEVPNTKPKQFILNNPIDDNRFIAIDVTEKPIQSFKKKNSFHERELHPILSYFLKDNDYFKAYSKTIFHEESFKGVRGEDKWLYPDIVAVNFEYANYRKNNVLSFIQKFDKPPIKIFSFEIKKELNFFNYKESFFQAVSNSSWANEGYLVAVDIKKDSQFIEALQKLSQSFGIGIIELNINSIDESNILSPARFKENMDYSVVDELANKNPNFAQFLKTITDFDVDNPNRFSSEFDKILMKTELNNHLDNKILK